MKSRVDTNWYSDGKKKSEYNYKVGFSIPFTPYFKITFYVKQEGLETYWYENGQKECEVTHKKGKFDGLSTLWYENGQKKEETTYKFDKEISSKEWNEDGTPKS